MGYLDLGHREVFGVAGGQRRAGPDANRSDQAVGLPQGASATRVIAAPAARQPRVLCRDRQHHQAVDERFGSAALRLAQATDDLLDVDDRGRRGDIAFEEGLNATHRRASAQVVDENGRVQDLEHDQPPRRWSPWRPDRTQAAGSQSMTTAVNPSLTAAKGAAGTAFCRS